MGLTVRERLRGKWAGARVLAQLLRHTQNGWEIRRRRKRHTSVERIALRRGPTIHARRDDDLFALFWEIVVQQHYTRPWFYRPRAEHTVVDLGANIGVFALACQRLAPGITVHAAEPNPDTYGRLRHNVERNGLDGVVHTYQLAVGRQRGTLYLKPGATVTGHQQLTAGASGTPIPCETLDGLFGRAALEQCDLLKIDTEGAELDIVEGASAALWRRIRRVVIEYHDNVHSEAGVRLERQLSQLGYVCRTEQTPGYPHLGYLYASAGDQWDPVG